MIRASITAGIRPSAMIFHEQPTEEWRPYDFKLLEAYQILDDETCKHCGNPVWICRSSSSNIHPVVKTARCQGKAALDKKDEARNDDKRARKAAPLKPGEYDYVVFEPVAKGLEMPTRDEWIAENTVE